MTGSPWRGGVRAPIADNWSLCCLVVRRQRPLVGLALLALGSLLLAALVLPRVLNVLEASLGVVPEYEYALRCGFALAMVTFLAGWSVMAPRPWSRPARLVWTSLVVAAGTLCAIFILDSGAGLADEQSWIRYPTTAALVSAGLVGVFVAVRARRDRESPVVSALWLVIGAGFCFLGADEVLQIHERVAQSVGGFVGGRAWVQDATTLAYVPIALLGLVGGARLARREWLRDGGLLVTGYTSAVIVFAVSQVLDSLDRYLLVGLRLWTDRLASAGHAFPDYWYLVSQPRLFANSAEEILECAAAVLFFTFTLLRAMRAAAQGQGEPDPPPPTRAVSAWRSHLAQAALVCFAISAVLWGWRDATAGDLDALENPLVWQFAGGVDVSQATALEAPALVGLPVPVHPRWMFREPVGVRRDNDGIVVVFGDHAGMGIVRPLAWRRSRYARDVSSSTR